MYEDRPNIANENFSFDTAVLFITLAEDGKRITIWSFHQLGQVSSDFSNILMKVRHVPMNELLESNYLKV